ncbi:MAG TPA: diaminopimelate epimerase [Rhabdochlamydiaceae bacterium]|jgi:diaminopimelate epimerase|nr:diaminopimelate epimerase [Rhabdochlamydiaceae bacterium]
MQLPFAKYHGAGNDFVIFDDRSLRFPAGDHKFIEHLCEHRLGVGADGVVLLQPSEKADFRMRIFNADGKEAAQCGNGLRCLVDFIRQMGYPHSNLTIETHERIVECSWEGDQITVDLGAYIWAHDNFPIDPFSLQLIHTGVPHAVAFVSDLAIPDFQSIASKLRFHKAFAPQGANVNFAEVKGNKIYTRTYERGVEEETLACGTGAAAVAIAAMKKYQLKNPICIVPASREELFVEVMPKTVKLKGRATFVFHGSICY